jgi:ABC-type glycerol-3-phosphate transport system permease component
MPLAMKVPFVAFLCALPFAFAIIRAVRTGSDLRYIWVALAGLVGAVAVMAVTKQRARTPTESVIVAAGVFVVSTLVSVLAAMALGTTLGPGILVVACSFGACFAAGGFLRLVR